MPDETKGDDPYLAMGYVRCSCDLKIYVLPGGSWLAPGPECDRHSETKCEIDRDALAIRNSRSEWICYQFHDQVVSLFDEDHEDDDTRPNVDQRNFDDLTERERQIFRSPDILRRMLVEAIRICGFKVGDLPIPEYKS